MLICVHLCSKNLCGENSPTRPAFVYIVECADGTLYTGWTNDLEKRVANHNAGKGAKYTRSRRPVKLVYSEILPDESAARRREIAIKRLTRQQKQQLIANYSPPKEQEHADG